jgi:hypothetical protein
MSAAARASSADVGYVDLPDGRVIAFGAVPAVAFNLTEARRRAARGVRTRQEAVADIYAREDGTWGLSDPVKELDLVTDLTAAVLFAHAAIEGLDYHALEGLDRGGSVWERLDRLSELRNALVRPGPPTDGRHIFGRLIRGDADACAGDAFEVVRAVRPELLP